MTLSAVDVARGVRSLLEQQGVVLSEQELSHLAERYMRAVGSSLWDVRAYVRPAGHGAREYRVVRGSAVLDVYCSPEQGNAAAVRVALNELEAQAVAGQGA